MPQPLIRVAIADREPAFRAGVRLALAADRFAVVAEAGSLAALAERCAGVPPDCVLVDEALAAGLRERPVLRSAHVAVVVQAPTMANLLGHLAAGALGCIGRDTRASRLPALVEDLAEGHPVVPPSLLPALLDDALRELRPRERHHPQLTRRQAQILTLHDEGLSDGQIARLLGLSPVTVRRHLSEVSARTGARARVHA